MVGGIAVFMEHVFVYFSLFILDCQIKIIHFAFWLVVLITSDIKGYTRDQMRRMDWFMKNNRLNSFELAFLLLEAKYLSKWNL